MFFSNTVINLDLKIKKNIIKNNGSKYFWNKIEPLNPKINNIDKKKLYIFSLDT